MGQKARAWKVLQEAVKCDYDNWKVGIELAKKPWQQCRINSTCYLASLEFNFSNSMKVWDNVMVGSTDLAHCSDVIKAYHRILDLKDRHVDAEVLRILATAIKDDLPDNADQPSSR